MEQLNDIERLAVAQAVYKVAAKLVNTKDDDNLRAQIDRGYKELYDATGAKSYDVNVKGRKVGTYSIKFSKDKPQETRMEFRVIDYAKLAQWFEGMDELTITDYAAQNLATFAEWVFRITGELADGCELAEVSSHGRAGEYIGGTLKINEHEVAAALGELMPPSFVAMLEGGEE